jgi:sec-independent protein translocase protein TatA
MLSLTNLIVILIIILLLFGANRVPEIMTDLAKGLKAFKDTLKSNEEDKKKEHNDKQE